MQKLKNLRTGYIDQGGRSPGLRVCLLGREEGDVERGAGTGVRVEGRRSLTSGRRWRWRRGGGGGRAPRAGCPGRGRRKWRSAYDWCPVVRIR